MFQLKQGLGNYIQNVALHTIFTNIFYVRFWLCDTQKKKKKGMKYILKANRYKLNQRESIKSKTLI